MVPSLAPTFPCSHSLQCWELLGMGTVLGSSPTVHVSQYMFLSNLITSKLATLLHPFAVWPSRRLPPLLQNKSLFGKQLSELPVPPVPACSHPSPSTFENFSNMLIYKAVRRGAELLSSIYTFHKDVLSVNSVHSSITQTLLLSQLPHKWRSIYLLFSCPKYAESMKSNFYFTSYFNLRTALIESKP